MSFISFDFIRILFWEDHRAVEVVGRMEQFLRKKPLPDIDLDPDLTASGAPSQKLWTCFVIDLILSTPQMINEKM
jgi:hypothetical protein